VGTLNPTEVVEQTSLAQLPVSRSPQLREHALTSPQVLPHFFGQLSSIDSIKSNSLAKPLTNARDGGA
jgi:hypothetical protein